MKQKQLDGAIPHFIEAGRMEKAIEAAINARQWTKAAQVRVCLCVHCAAAAAAAADDDDDDAAAADDDDDEWRVIRDE